MTLFSLGLGMAQTWIAQKASSSAKNWAAQRQELMRKAEERREQIAQGQLTEEHTFKPAVPRTPRLSRPSTSKLTKVVKTVSTATQTEKSEAKAKPDRPRSQGRTVSPCRSVSPQQQCSERLSSLTASFAQRNVARLPSAAPLSVPLQKWMPVSFQKDSQSLAALALAVVGTLQNVAGASPVSATPASPEHAGSVPHGLQQVEEAADLASPVPAGHLCTDSSLEDVHSKSNSQPEVERPLVVAEDSIDEVLDTLDTPALRFEDIKTRQLSRVRFSFPSKSPVCHERAPIAPRRHYVEPLKAATGWCPRKTGAGSKAEPCRFAWEEIAPDSASDNDSSSEATEREEPSNRGRIQYRSFVLPRASGEADSGQESGISPAAATAKELTS